MSIEEMARRAAERRSDSAPPEDSPLDELEERLEKAAQDLLDLANEAGRPNEWHLRAKADGVALALSYVQEMKRR